MKSRITLLFALLIALLTPACTGKNANTNNSTTGVEKTDSVTGQQQNRRRGPDYNVIRQSLALTAEQETQFDAVIEKYRQVGEANRASFTGADGKVDRVVMFEKMEEVRKQQSSEMATFLTADQITQFEEFVEKNSRKRPGYSQEVLAQIKTDLKLDDAQSQMLDVVKKAFEKSYHDAHDIYHGNPELASEYWSKYDEERKNALKQVFSATQYEQYLEIVKAISSPNRK